MAVDIRSLLVAMAYALLLSWIFIVDITVHWAYMGFIGEFSWGGLAFVMMGTFVLSAATRGEDTRGYILISMVYIYFIPSLIFIGFGLNPLDHAAGFALMAVLVYVLSAVRMEAVKVQGVSPNAMLYTVFALIVFGVVIQAWFGGLTYFNLDLDLVYQYREAAASQLPALFGYFYSNISTVLVPVALLFALRFNAMPVAFAVLVCAVVLFGMTQHKVVLFGPFAILFLYFFYRLRPKLWVVGIAFMAMPVLSAIEILVDQYVYQSNTFAYFTALFVRRTLFFPPVLDGSYIEYFGSNAKFYWSSSSVGALFATNPYGITPPYVIGYEYFANADTSANTGLVGSGFANAGLVGIALYAAVVGLMIAYINAYGRKLDHGLVTAVTLMTMYNIFTSTDLLTAFLTHGALLLMILLIFFPTVTSAKPVPQRLAAA